MISAQGFLTDSQGVVEQIGCIFVLVLIPKPKHMSVSVQLEVTKPTHLLVSKPLMKPQPSGMLSQVQSLFNNLSLLYVHLCFVCARVSEPLELEL